MTEVSRGPGRTLPANGNVGDVVENGEAAEWVAPQELTYTPTTAADWGVTKPTSLGQALDLIAAAITL